MRDTGTAAAVSPTSNLFLGSGLFDLAAADAAGGEKVAAGRQSPGEAEEAPAPVGPPPPAGP